jgi:kumamolisin
MLSALVFTGNAQNLMTHHVRQATRDDSAPQVGHLSSTQTMRLVLTLPLRHEEELDSLLEDLYNPNSPNFRQFLSVEQFTERFGPTQDDYDLAIDYAQSHGLKVVGTSANRLNIDVVGSVANIENALHIKMNWYKHPSEGRNFYAPDREPSVDLPFSLWHISGLDNFSIPKPAGLNKRTGSQPSATVGSGPSGSFLGSDMRAAYYGTGTTLTGTGQSVALFEFEGIDLADVTTYYKNIKQTNTIPITVKSTDGTSTSCLNSSGCDDTEQVLDVTQALGMAPGLASLIVYVGSTDASILNTMASDDSSAQIGCSWAWRPADPSTDDPYFKEMGTQGQNFFVAAGDSGKWPTRRSPYYFPADDDYVVSVGGTSLTTNSAGGTWKSEAAWSSGGGGITPDSIVIPSWQVTTANSCSSCSKTLRNAPDVSANADYTFYVCADQTTCTANLYGGTSFAAPMWAGYLALVNQQAVSTTGKTVGFINPALYSIGMSSAYNTDFHDITSGSNGYSAITGYDLATGWGSPNGQSLITDIIAGGSSGGGGGSPDFSISAGSSSLSVSRGSSNTDKITINDTGGASSVSLSASGQESGVTVSFSPSSLSNTGSSTMTVKASRNATRATFTVTITGKGATTSHATQVSVTIN